VKAFSERNPITIAALGLVMIGAVLAATYYSDNLPIIGGGTTYSADFSEAAGLKSGNEVRIAGVKVGAVRSVKLEGTHVLVKFRVKHAWIGDQSTAAIKIKTLLGQKYLAIDPQGTGKLDAHTAIPLKRTSAPYDVTEAFEGLSNTVGKIDTTQLAASFETISDTFKNTPASVRTMLTGLTALSKTIASRDDKLRQLVDNTKQVTGTLSSRNDQFASLINDGNLLLGELQQRRDAIVGLLQGTRDLGIQLSGLVADNQDKLKPTLQQLSRVTDILQQNQDNLDNALRLIAPYYRLLNNSLGNGPWIDIYICGLFNAANEPILDAQAKRDCTPKAANK
jgi:phospholipid/cholesterol/gamma-HCH transport system substrate-binding protein